MQGAAQRKRRELGLEDCYPVCEAARSNEEKEGLGIFLPQLCEAARRQRERERERELGFCVESENQQRNTKGRENLASFLARNWGRGSAFWRESLAADVTDHSLAAGSF